MLRLPFWIRYDSETHTQMSHTQCCGWICLKCCGPGRGCLGLTAVLRVCVCVCVCEAGTYMPSSLSASTRYFKPQTLLVGPLLSFSFVPHTVLLLLPQRKGSEPEVSDVCGFRRSNQSIQLFRAEWDICSPADWFYKHIHAPHLRSWNFTKVLFHPIFNPFNMTDHVTPSTLRTNLSVIRWKKPNVCFILNFSGISSFLEVQKKYKFREKF